MKRFSRVYFLLASVAALAFVVLALPAAADTIVQSFNASGTIQPDWVVALKPGSNDTVELAPAGKPQLIYGVAIDPSQAPVTLQRSSSQQVFVASSGTYQTLVSTENGAIQTGDYLSISSTDGIAAKATTGQAGILGRALEKFDGSSGVLTKSSTGASVGLINVGIAPGRNPLVINGTDLAIPGFLKRAGNSVAGKDVSALRIYAALAVFLIVTMIALNVTLVGIRSAMTAIGRNPLGRHSIVGSLIQVSVVAIALLFLGIFSVYLLLKL